MSKHKKNIPYMQMTKITKLIFDVGIVASLATLLSVLLFFIGCGKGGAFAILLAFLLGIVDFILMNIVIIFDLD